MPSPHRARPADEALTKPFWESARRGVLAVQRCATCAMFQHPPQPQCTACGATSQLEYQPVSGTARLVTWTRVCQAFVGGFEEVVPYYNIVVELIEQSGLYMVSDYLGADDAFAARLRAGATMHVTFEEVASGMTLPQFRFAKDAL
ncbi:MAG: hypothetical protein NVS3B16_26490 [Vulcanimicrobiaceae bacterium]